MAEAEERLAAEQAELDRVVTLAATLDLTTTFLRRAQDRVYRDIAPVLVRTLERWLPGVTGGRYVDAMVDPATLVVQVRGPNQPWRRADLLSVGTAEQVYLLLRVALAEALAVTGETCPLLLDDVTVQADPVRTARILDLLLTLAQDRQIVLFAQEPMVAQWAQAALTGDQHALIEARAGGHRLAAVEVGRLPATRRTAVAHWRCVRYPPPSTGETMDPKNTAVVLIEYQNDFTTRGRRAARRRRRASWSRTGMLANTRRAGRCRARGRCHDRARADHLRRGVQRDHLDTRTASSRASSTRTPSSRAPGAPRSSTTLAPEDGDIVIEGKRGLDTFASTNLDFILRSKGIQTDRARRLPDQLLRRVDHAHRLRERLSRSSR